MAKKRKLDDIHSTDWAKRMSGRKGTTGVDWTRDLGLKTELGRAYRSWMGGAVLPVTPFFAKHGRLPEEGEV